MEAPRSPRIQPPVLVGEHADGTLYVVDRLDEGYHWLESTRGQDLSPRLFLSSGDTLVQRDGGAGSSSAYTYEWGGFFTRDASVSGAYRLDRDRDQKHVDPADTKMRLRESEPQYSLEDLLSQGLSREEATAQLFEEQTPLKVLSECAVEDFEPEFLSVGPRIITYVAQDERGHHILVTAPPRHYDGYDFKVFYGPPGQVLEYPTAEPIARERDGGTTTIRFKIDGLPAELYFPVNTLSGGNRQPRITLPEQTLAVTLLSEIVADQDLPAGMTYVCHDQPY